MASVSWTATSGGIWSNTGNWSLATGPLTGDDVSISSASSITVTYTSGSLTLGALTTNNATLSVSAGTLAVTNGFSLTGGLNVSGGLLRLSSPAIGSAISGSVALTGGTLALSGGALFQNGPAGNNFSQSTASTVQVARGGLTVSETFATLAGSVTGSGALILASTTTTLSAGFTLSTASLNLSGGTVYLNENLSYGNAFTLGSGATFNLGSYTLNLSGLGSLNGTLANSTANLTGTGHFNGLTLANGTLLTVGGTYTQIGAINLGQTGTGTLSIGAGGTLRVAGNYAVTNSNTAGILINAGKLIKTAGNAISGVETISATVVNTGTIDVAVGTMVFSGPSNGTTSTLDGTITGAGTMALTAGNFAIVDNAFSLTVARTVLAVSANVTLTSNQLSYGGAFDQTGGVLVVGTPGQPGGSTLTLTGSDAFDGGLLKGTGTVLCSGAVNLGGNATLEGNLTFDFGNSTSPGGTGTAVISQTSNIQLGAELDAITIANVEAGESWFLKGPSSILGVNGTINNYGLFEKLSGSGNSTVQNNLNNFGALVVNSGLLTLSGNGGGVLGGTVSGTGALDIAGNVTFASNLNLSVGEVVLDGGQIGLLGNLAYAHGWSQAGGTLGLNGHTLTLSGVTSLEYGAIQGSGTVVVNGAATIGQGPVVNPASISLLQGAQLVFNGNTEQASTIALTGGSVAPTLTVGAASTYSLDTGVSIGVTNSSVVGTLVVAGTLAASGAGTSTLGVAVVDNNVIKIANGDLSFLGPLSGTGSLAISSGGTLELNNTSLEHNAIGFGTGGGLLSLAHPEAFGSIVTGFAAGDGIELQGFAFAPVQTIISGNTVSITEAGGQSATLTFATAQTGSLLVIGEGPHGGLTLFHV